MKSKFTKTKILATVGPAIDKKEILESLIDAGVDGFRLNFSHGNFAYFDNVFNIINEICVGKSLPIPIFVDLQGPKIRIGQLSSPEIEIKTGNTIEITIDDILGTAQKISTSYGSLVKDCMLNEIILIDDGLIKLKIKEKKSTSIICEILEGGILKPKKGMNLPGMKLSTPSVTEIDLINLEFALNHRVDFIALSFVRKADDIINLRKWLDERGISKPIIAKIEKPEAVANFEEILSAADGIMVARGDLGVELAPQDVPIIQKKIIHRCNAVGKLVITATQMLETMVNNPIPTRAEASDVANAVWDGTDVVMLSAETSVGKYPIRAVETMSEIIFNSEQAYQYDAHINYQVPNDVYENLFDSMNRGICSVSKQINARAIVALTSKGNTPYSLSKYRPKAKIIAVSDSFDTMNKLSLKWGVASCFFKDISDRNSALETARRFILENKFAEKDDLIIFTEGGAKEQNVRENWIRFEVL